MAVSYVFSRAADRDILALFSDSITKFGEVQTNVYVTGLRAVFDLLATHPDIGATFEHPRSGRTYRRHRHGSHFIYYRQREADILIVRLLHVRMLPEKHL